MASLSLLILPLLFLDSLPARRPARVAMLFALVGLAAAPPLLEPRSIVEQSCHPGLVHHVRLSR